MKYYYLNLLNNNGESKSILTDKFRYKNIMEKLSKDFPEYKRRIETKNKKVI